MIRCTKCETINPDSAVFCSNCFSFLEWTGEKVDPSAIAAAKPEAKEEPKPEAPAEPEPEPAPEPAPEPEVAEPAGPAPEPEVAEPAGPAPEPEVVEPAEPEPEPKKPRRRRRKRPAEAAPAPVAAEPEPVAAEPEPVAAEPVEEPEPAPAPPPGPSPEQAAPRVPLAAAAATPAPARPVRRPLPPPPPPPPLTPRRVEPVVRRLEETPPALRTESEPPAETKPVEPPIERPKPTFRFRAEPAAPSRPAAATPAARTATPTATSPTPRPTVQPAAARPAATPPASTQPVARRPTDMPAQPASRKPTAEVVRPARRAQPTSLAAEPEIKPGDLICSVCGAGNDPARRFCRRCGNSLATAVVARKPPWYRRLFGRRRAYAAGERPGAMGTAGQPRRSRVKPLVLIVLVGAVLALVAGYFVDSRVKSAIDGLIGSARNVFETSTHQAPLAFDDDIATFWLVDPGEDGTPSARVPLTDTIDVIGVRIHSGAGGGDLFKQYRRPRTVEFRFPSAEPIEIPLDDDPAAQEFNFEMPAVGEYEFRIVDYYDAEEDGQVLIALREVILLTASQ